MIVSPRAPWSISASISSSGMPAVPKPPIITVAPSAMSATAEAQVHCDLSIIPAASGHRADAALVDLVVDAVDQCGQREVEADLAERPVHVVGLDRSEEHTSELQSLMRR